MPSSFAKMTIVRKRYPIVDDMGTMRPNTDAAPHFLTITRCWCEPTESTVEHDGQVLTVTGYRIAAPKGADILARDVIVIDGTDYLAEGDAQHVPSPTGRLAQTLVTVRRWQRG